MLVMLRTNLEWCDTKSDYMHSTCITHVHNTYVHRHNIIIIHVMTTFKINALKCREPSPALMQMSTCAYLITRVAFEGRVTLAKMAENSLKF